MISHAEIIIIEKYYLFNNRRKALLIRDHPRFSLGQAALNIVTMYKLEINAGTIIIFISYTKLNLICIFFSSWPTLQYKSNVA